MYREKGKVTYITIFSLRTFTFLGALLPRQTDMQSSLWKIRWQHWVTSLLWNRFVVIRYLQLSDLVPVMLAAMVGVVTWPKTKLFPGACTSSRSSSTRAVTDPGHPPQGRVPPSGTTEELLLAPGTLPRGVYLLQEQQWPHYWPSMLPLMFYGHNCLIRIFFS